MIDLTRLTPGSSYIVKLTAVDTNDNMSSRKENLTLADVTVPVINDINTSGLVIGHITVAVNISKDSSGSVVAIAY